MIFVIWASLHKQNIPLSLSAVAIDAQPWSHVTEYFLFLNRQEEERRRREEEMLRKREMEEQMRRQREENYRMGNFMDVS